MVRVRPQTAQDLVNRRFSVELSRDPLTAALKPPENETMADKRYRLALEQDAKARSDAIDRDIERVRKMGYGVAALGIESSSVLSKASNNAKVIQMLLLGNTEAGKSTFCRQLRMLYDRQSIDREKEACRLAILLCLVTHTRLLLDLLEHHSATTSLSASTNTRESGAVQNPIILRRMRLAPLLALEEGLRDHLGIVSLESGPSGATFAAHAATSSSRSPTSYRTPPTSPRSPNQFQLASNLYVRPAKWAALPGDECEGDEPVRRSKAPGRLDDTALLVCGCSEEIGKLWRDAVMAGLIAGDGPVQGEAGGAIVGDGAKYFFASLERITLPGWSPTDQDILQLRVATLGVEEHVVAVEPSLIWRVIDVEGAKGGRHKWAAHFMSANMIIFVAAISDYDIILRETDGRLYTKLHETIQLFDSVIGNKLLKDSSLLLFHNKVDILRRKLRSGRSPIHDFFPRCELVKTAEPVDQVRLFFKNYFQAVFNKSPYTIKGTRSLYIHSMTAVDTKSTRLTLAAVHDIVTRKSLVNAGML